MGSCISARSREGTRGFDDSCDGVVVGKPAFDVVVDAETNTNPFRGIPSQTGRVMMASAIFDAIHCSAVRDEEKARLLRQLMLDTATWREMAENLHIS